MKIIKGFPLLDKKNGRKQKQQSNLELAMKLGQGRPIMLEKSKKKQQLKSSDIEQPFKWKWTLHHQNPVKAKKNKSTKKWESLEKCQRVATSCFSSISFSSLTSKAFKRTSEEAVEIPRGLVDESNRFNNQTKEDFIPKNLHGFMLANLNTTSIAPNKKMCFCLAYIIWYHLISPILRWFESRCMDTFEFCQEIFSEKIKFHFCKSRWCTRRRAWNGHC